MEVVAEAFELGSLVRVDQVFGSQVMDTELLGQGRDLFLARIVAVDPEEAGVLVDMLAQFGPRPPPRLPCPALGSTTR